MKPMKISKEDSIEISHYNNGDHPVKTQDGTVLANVVQLDLEYIEDFAAHYKQVIEVDGKYYISRFCESIIEGGDDTRYEYATDWVNWKQVTPYKKTVMLYE